ncbi:MAG TPA: methionine synthase, partial [Gammaproteobacteria bacterium]|nr:methionine synthase [Gammaproteobacteria bacterium]
ILKDGKVGAAATELFADAQALLKQILAEKLLKARAIIGFWPANTVACNDVQLYQADEPDAALTRLHFLRQQIPKDVDLDNLCLADFVAPATAGYRDYLGAFVVTAGIGADKLAAHFEAEHNDYSALLVKALADRLAEAFAEQLHKRVRMELWGYEPAENLSPGELIKEKYRGIRPAPGYPACPDHSEKATVFELLQADAEIGVKLTESFAMTPAATVSGLYFSHPQSRYFSVGKISTEQVKDLAIRKNTGLDELTRLLSPNLGSL